MPYPPQKKLKKKKKKKKKKKPKKKNTPISQTFKKSKKKKKKKKKKYASKDKCPNFTNFFRTQTSNFFFKCSLENFKRKYQKHLCQLVLV